MICYRNLFKRMHLIFDNKSQIPLASFLKALSYLEMSTDYDEIECILANLIYRGYIRGYIAHTKRILVLSKRDPFPLSAIVR
jgi:PCI domain